uniref:Uncharacterized protein n=1 Tax=Anguilla anguilla TaxID=7936 RepID=A0A0E9W5K9_ANGAN
MPVSFLFVNFEVFIVGKIKDIFSMIIFQNWSRCVPLHAYQNSDSDQN